MSDQLNHLSTQGLFQQLGNPGLKVIDVRPVDAYNSWRFHNEPRGGRIWKEAQKSLPFKWTKYIDWIEIVRSKDIRPEHSLILYGYDDTETTKVAGLFIRSGYPNVRIYPAFVDEWAENENYPLDKLAHYRQGGFRQLAPRAAANRKCP